MANLASYTALGGLLGSRNRKQASAAGSSNYDSQAPRSGSLHGTSNSWGGKWSEDYSARDQDRFAGAPADERLYVASNAGRGPEKMADFRDPDYISELGMGDLTRYVQGNSAPQGSMAGLAAGDPSVMGGRRGVGMSPTNAFDPRVSHGSFIAGTRASGFAGPSLPIGKGDSIDPSRENHGKASSGKEHVASPFADLLGMEFAAVIADLPVQGKFSSAQAESLVSTSDSSGSSGSLSCSFSSRSSLGDEKASKLVQRAMEDKKQAELRPLTAEETNQSALEAQFIADTSPILEESTGTCGLRASVLIAPLVSRAYTSSEMEVLQAQLDLTQKMLEKKAEDYLSLEHGTRTYMIKAKQEKKELRKEKVQLERVIAELSQHFVNAVEVACIDQEKLCAIIKDQRCSLQVTTRMLQVREQELFTLRQENDRLVNEMKAARSVQADEMFPNVLLGDKMYIQQNVSLDVFKAMEILDKELLAKKLEEEEMKREIEEEIIAEIVGLNVVQVVPEVFAEICEEIGEVTRKAVEEAGAGPVAQKLQAESSPKQGKPSHEYVIEHLKKQSYSPDAFTRILEDDSVVKDLEKYPFFQAVFSSQALKQNLPRFCEDILHEADKLYGRKLNIGNSALLSMLKVILLERKPFSLESLRNFRVNGVFHNSCIPIGKPSENLDAFDDTAMSYHNDRKTFFKYFVTVYVSWKTDGSELFAELVAKIRGDK